MATTVVDDHTDIQSYDTLVGFGINNVGDPATLTADPAAQGSNSVSGRVTGTGVSGQGFNAGSTDVSTDHVMQWVQTLNGVNTRANDGWRIRLATATNATANFKDITVAGGDTARVRVEGFSSFCCNALRSGENINGTPPAATAVISFSVLADHLSATNRETWFTDQVKQGTKITLTAGTVSVPGNSDDVAAADITDGRGTFIDANGAFYIVGGIDIGDITAATDSHFTDKLRIWLFQDQPVKNNFHKIETLGGSGTNAVTFGTEIGSGVTAVGVGGNVFLTASPTSACFRVLNTDADITAKYFGCTFINSLYEDHSFQSWTDDGGSFTNNTRAWNITAVTAALFPAVEVANDALYVSDRDEPLYGVEVDLSTLGAGTPVLAFEYHNGTAWVAFPSLSDGTSGLTADGRITWSKPADWSAVAVNAITAFYMRIRLVSGTFSTNPVGAALRPLHAGPIKLETANVRAVSCLFSGCGPITVRNGALLRKSTITDSNAGVVGAVDLGAADPVTDSVRDLQVQNSAAGILLRDVTRFFNAAAAVDKGAGKVGIPDTAHGFATGQSITIAGTTNYNGTFTVDATSSANEIVITATFVAETFATTDSAVPNTAYNFRNIGLAGNTKDVRVDFPSGSTVTINVLEGGTSLVAGNIDNVNASTIVINNATVITLVNVKDNNAVNLPNARVILEAADGAGDFPFEDVVTITRVTTVASVAHTAHGMVNGNKVVIRGADQQEYNGVFAITNVTANAYDYTVSGTPATPATGTITASGVILEGLTDASGNISDTRTIVLDSAMKGFVRKSTASPRFKSRTLAGTVDNLVGLTINVRMILDEK